MFSQLQNNKSFQLQKIKGEAIIRLTLTYNLHY